MPEPFVLIETVTATGGRQTYLYRGPMPLNPAVWAQIYYRLAAVVPEIYHLPGERDGSTPPAEAGTPRPTR